jgi:Protein of unknown function (DUF3592)
MRMGYTIVLLIGIILFVVSILLFNKSLQFIKTADRATAKVIQVDTSRGNKGGLSYEPIFEFKTNTNKKVIYRQGFSSSFIGYKIGDLVEISYLPDNPQKAKLLTPFGAFRLTLIFMAIAMPFIVIGGGYYFVQRFLNQ